MALRSAVLNVMVSAAEKASRRIVRDFGEIENLQVSRKGTKDFVTAADLRTEKILKEELSKARPSFSFLIEKSGETVGTDPNRRWIVDPINGTTNFMHGIPHFAISIALQEHGDLIAAVVYNPVLNDLFLAEKGQGATLNNRRLRVSGREQLADCVLATGIPHEGHAEQLQSVISTVAGVRQFGSTSLDLAFVAAGRVDGFWESSLSICDVAAGILLVRESGGFVTDIGGKGNGLEDSSILAANTHIHRPLASLLTKKPGFRHSSS